ncbi:MAG: hypothetical protein MSIBF_02370 [Candidatus Altiarchaeales archaeon IMC4]|nr:MAG: hypothetical protein MSIBF_02370 [Candidatus Altiarchaeales archaeon IMC4]
MEKVMQKKVRDVMSRGVVTVGMDAPVKEIIDSLLEEHITGLVVTAPNGEAMGVISDRDIINVAGYAIRELTADDIMNSSVKDVRPDMTLGDAVEIMKREKVHRLLVLSEDTSHARHGMIPVGILSASDILREIARNL